MAQYWIYIIVGVVVFLVIVAIGWYYFSNKSNKYLKQELFEGEAYCIVIDKIREDSNLLGKRKM